VLSGLTFFLASQLLLTAAIETRWRIVRDPVHFTRLQHLERKIASATSRPRTILFLGTSRFELGVQTQVLERQLSSDLGRPVVVANWGMGGWGLVRPLLAWGRVEREGLRPDLVMIEVLPVLLGHDHPLDTRNPVLPGSELDGDDLEIVLRHDPESSHLRQERLQALLVPVHGHRHNLLRLVRPSLVQAWGRPLEQLPFDTRATWPAEIRPLEKEKARLGYGGQFSKFRLSQDHVHVLEDLLTRLREAGVPAALVVMPEGPWFRRLYPPGVWGQIENCLSDLSDRHGVPLIHLREWIDDENEFNDSHHFTAEGADRFSERLGREVLVPMLRWLEASGRLVRR
jgi:hypothetical protein